MTDRFSRVVLVGVFILLVAVLVQLYLDRVFVPAARLADLTDKLEELGVGKSIQLSVLRNGRTTSLEMQVADVSRQG